MDALLSPKDQLIANLREQIAEIDRRMAENESIVEQNQLEVDRLQQKNIHVGAQLRRVEDNFDTVPRQDIKVAFESVIDIRSRLTIQRSQLEKLQDAQRYLEQQRDELAYILETIGDVDVVGGDSGSGGAPTLSLAGEQIVRIIEAQESERKRLANALHDGPAQSLTNFILQAEICQRLFDRDPEMASKELINLKSAASVSFQKIRDFIFELRPMMLDDLGLIATVRRHVESHNEKLENVAVEFHLTGPGDRRFPSHVEVMMFRSLQLCLTNAIELLSAKNIDVRLDVGDTQLKGYVESDGRIVNVEVELDPSQGDSPLQNILDIRERIDMVGGKIEYISIEGAGNTFEVMLPIIEK